MEKKRNIDWDKYKKRLLICAILVSFFALLAGGSVAYFTSQEIATGTFMITSYDPDDPDQAGDDIFSIRVYEHDSNNNNNEVNSLVFKDIAPGSILDKDPTIENMGNYTAWIRVNAEFSNAKNWIKTIQKHKITDLVTLFDEYKDKEWYRENNQYTYNEENDTLTYTFYAIKPLRKHQKIVLFRNFIIPSYFDVEDMSNLKYFELRISADAIQEANTGNSSYEAFSNYWQS